MTSTGQATGAALEPGGIGQWGQQTTFVFKKSPRYCKTGWPVQQPLNQMECRSEGERALSKEEERGA